MGGEAAGRTRQRQRERDCAPGRVPAAAGHASEGVLRLEQELQSQGIPIRPEAFRPAGILIEEYQQGSEYSAEGIFVDGRTRVLALTAKATTGPPHFIETGHVLPTPLSPEIARAAREQVAAVLVTVGLRWGCLPRQILGCGARRGAATSGSTNSDGGAYPSPIVLGELHVSLGGDYIYVLTQVVIGVELHGSIFDQMLGRRPELGTGTASGAAAVGSSCPRPAGWRLSTTGQQSSETPGSWRGC
ncbi:ATP-grasp domain-containing protein [Jatrophihabitans lederbergiae]|uniref:ATP-grasp domain-containing protein n=1 Tax=Jatrophihabitans lederbergiae TaxID=3075547 RepID=A0ABU2J7R3_9ACTN|nr:ATP-grasp domain-containing protein [Jatrophihabitans sp. DSM 44399]MDT0261031.1 ATP-grasp domain-containing protein [Jatrophihabitans sp. DSM 44399]